jgi:hypothetical protein
MVPKRAGCLHSVKREWEYSSVLFKYLLISNYRRVSSLGPEILIRSTAEFEKVFNVLALKLHVAQNYIRTLLVGKNPSVSTPLITELFNWAVP